MGCCLSRSAIGDQPKLVGSVLPVNEENRMLVVAVGNPKWEQAGRIGSTGGARRDRMLVVTVGNRELANEYVSSGEMRRGNTSP